MAQLVVVEGPDKGKVFPIEGKRAVIGRDADCGAALTDGAVSRRHCEVRFAGDRWEAADAGSRNQTFLNNDPITVAPIEDGDLLGVGDTELRFELEPEEVPAEDLKTTILREFRLAEPAVEAAGDRLMAKLSFLADIARKVEGAPRSRELLAITLEALRGVVGAHWGVALLRVKGAWHQAARAGARVKCAFSRTLLERLVERHESVLCANVAADPALSDRESISLSGVQAIVAAPLQSRGELLGALYFARREGEFAPEDLLIVSGTCNQIALLLQNLVRQESLERDRQNLLAQIQEQHKIVGNSPAIARLLGFIARAAAAEATVLIRGDTGTGKELVASAIHYTSARAGKPFVQLNCAAIPESLLESELFGHEKGAFTGATSRKHGHFEVADGGTVFLDEIGDLSLGCQAKVLRLIEEKKFERVGGTESIRVDVRIIAATHRDLKQAMEEGRFREDLYWRLDVLHAELPPLRERHEDIPLLAEYFLEKLAAPRGVRVRLAPAARAALVAYPWPGNVRQLKNVIENAVIMSAGDVLDVGDLRLIDVRKGGGGPPAETGKPRSLAEVEKEHILRVLADTKGNKKRAADILGIERCTLYARLKAYGYKEG
jgi:transcriptional regulator with GAF, ATPase, and Fis domain